MVCQRKGSLGFLIKEYNIPAESDDRRDQQVAWLERKPFRVVEMQCNPL
jgi:hypothetical protein